MERQIILLTDFGTKDPYVGMMKGVITTISQNTKIIDLTHEIEAGNIKEASYILSSSYQYFAQGSIFAVVVDPGVGSSRKPIAIKTDNYFFVGPDNGIFTHTLNNIENLLEVVELNNEDLHLKKRSHTFHGRDIFAPTAAYIANNIPLHNLGSKIDKEDLIKLPDLKLEISDKIITAEIIHFDRFGNIITSIPTDTIKGKSVKEVQTGSIKTANYKRTFADVSPGELVAYPGSSGYIEIAVRNGNAYEEYKIKKTEPVKISFF